MVRILTALALGGLVLTGCKPTPRTNPDAVREMAEAAKRAEAEKKAAEAKRAAAMEAERKKQEELAKPKRPTELSSSLLCVTATLQRYQQLTPWQKDQPSRTVALGVYVGNNLVLTTGNVARAATYVELSLPDESRTVPARVLRYDSDLNLALLSVHREEDASIFDSCAEMSVGHPLKPGEQAELAGVINGREPMRVALRAEGACEGATFPRLNLRAEQPLPPQHGMGAPIVKDGQMVAMAAGFDSEDMLLASVNAEQMKRFISTTQPLLTPVLGVKFTLLNDPAFCRYLKLDPAAGGLYISDVLYGGVAAEMGIAAGDVLLAIDDMPLDNMGRCRHAIYGMLDAAAVIRGHKPVGESMKLTISHHGDKKDVTVALNRNAYDYMLMKREADDARPRYILWGGMLFQPITQNYLQSLAAKANGDLPKEYQELDAREEEFRARGCRELIGLNMIIPTEATLGYEELRFCVVEAVNGKPVPDMETFASLLDEDTPDGITHLRLNKTPYNIYLDRAMVNQVDEMLRARMMPQLRYLGTPNNAE